MYSERGGEREGERRARSVACLQFVPETLKMHCALCRQRRSGDAETVTETETGISTHRHTHRDRETHTGVECTLSHTHTHT